MRNISFLVLAAAAVSVGTAACQAAEVRVLDIGSQVQLFCDDWLIGSMRGVSLRMHSPVVRDVAITGDAPWENDHLSYGTLMRDGDEYRLYYSAGGELKREYTCVALSKDGIHWERPKLGLFEYEGSKDNNIIWTGENKAYDESHNFSPFIDENPACPKSERYKAVSLRIMVPKGETGRRRVMMGYVSADGVHWKRIQEDPIITDGSFDSHNTLFWDHNLKQYVCYLRVGREGKRSVARATSRDFIHWTKSEPLDFGKTPLEHFYTNSIEPYFRNPSLYLGFPMRFIPREERDKVGFEQRQTDGLSDAVFMSSHDGLHWNRPFMEAFIRPGLDPYNWGSAHGNQTPVWHIYESGPGEISILWLDHYDPYTLWMGGNPVQIKPDPNNIIRSRFVRGTLRLDGFVSVNAPYAGGEFVTKALKFSGKDLVMNFSTSAVGSVRVEVQDESGKPIPGFSLRDCPPIWGDEIDRVVGWKNGHDVSKLAGKAVRLRFVMKDADLYSVRFRQ